MSESIFMERAGSFGLSLSFHDYRRGGGGSKIQIQIQYGTVMEGGIFSLMLLDANWTIEKC